MICMKRCLLLTAYLLFTSLLLSAQNLQKLEQQLQTAKTNRNKIYALYAIADYYTYTLGKDSMANLYGDKQIALANQTGNKELMALAYYLEGERLIQTVPSEKRFGRAKDCLYRTIQIAIQNNLAFYGAAAYIALSRPYYIGFEIDGDKALELGNNALKLSTSIANDSLLSLSLVSISVAYKYKKDNTNAYRIFQDALQVAERLDDPYLLAYCYRALGDFYQSLGELNKALSFYLNAEQSMERKKVPSQNELYWLYWIRQAISNLYADMGNEQKAKEYINKYSNQAKAFDMQELYKLEPLIQQVFLQIALGNYYEARKLYWNPEVEKIFLAIGYGFWYYNDRAFTFQNTDQADSAAYYYKKAFANEDKSQPSTLPHIYNDYAGFLWSQNKPREAIHFFELAESKSKEVKNLDALTSVYHNLDSFYFKSGNIQKAYEYNKLYHRYNDSLMQLSQEKELALLEVKDEQKKMEQERLNKQAKAEYHNRMRNIAFTGGLIGLLIIASIFYRNNRQKQKANTLLQQQKDETEKAFKELNNTQAQLIQSEKMASLGELTAGIAHEIQNPLNFVNNFSEVNKEMLEELRAERLKPKAERDEQTEDEIINDVIDNSEKINHHGKRAGDIVKSMLQHSRTSTGVKEPTDINALADEYLRLSYHGMRAKDKSFNATMKTDFDETIGKINIIPQDIGRVLLNLYNNAFYACAERSRSTVNQQKNENLILNAKEVTPFQKVSPLYEPTISVTTKKSENHVIITVSDNGNGIPQKIVDKIFQPFFTTKPTGQGTGLGLSLSYDIIKAHGGEIKVESLSTEAAAQAGKENEVTEFIIQLPVIQ